ncbi:tetratricopeptide repeat protein, partial [Streptomyces sp. ACA25]|uniref:tetratricopeptide repeat protein n=1 Tax=Streptomyces sp. ACA25 TaxID=3022596 RepID=UPI002307D255
MAPRPMSRREKFRQQQGQSFVGRRGELAVFEANLRRTVEDEEYRCLFHVRGQSGVGKSTLVRRWRGYAEEARASTVFLGDEVHGPLEVMKAAADQLSRQGVEMGAFTKRLAQLRQRQREIERALPRGEGSPGAELAAHAAATVTGAALGMPLGIEQLARGAGKLRDQSRERRDVDLVLDPVGELTPVFVSDLTEVARDRPWVVLFFDVYERTGPSLDRWLCDLVAGERYGDLPLKVIVVIAGQVRLAPVVWGEMGPYVEEVLLEAFTEEEARDLLARRGVVDEEVIRTVLSLSDRLPVLVDMLATPRPAQPGEVIDPAETAVERFLKWEADPERRRAILDCALPQEVDCDVYRALIAPDAGGGAESWLASLPFITSHGGRYRYHDVVRNQILRLQRSRSAADWRQCHTVLAGHHAQQRTDLEVTLPDVEVRWETERWRDYRAAEMYHWLCGAPYEARLPVLEDCIHACGEDVETLNRWVRLIRQAGHDSGSKEVIAWSESLADTEPGQPQPLAALRALLKEPSLSDTARALTHATRGNHHRKAGNLDQALTDYTRAIELEPNDEYNHHWRGTTHHEAGNLDQALTDLTRAIELNPNNEY